MKYLGKALAFSGLFVVVGILFYSPLPLSKQAQYLGLPVFLSISGFALFLVATYLFFRWQSKKKIFVNMFLVFSALLVCYFLIGAFVSDLLPAKFWLSLALLALSASTLSAYFALQKFVSWAGLLGFALTFSCIVSAELFLRGVPSEFLRKDVVKTPPMAPEDQVNIVYRKNHFRGKKPCSTCSNDLIRIVTLGGSSTYGVPMHYRTRTYSAELQRLLEERRPGERYEVLNAGIAAFGIMQVVSALKEEIIQFKPDIVTVNSWFNDSAPANRWYRIPGVSDREGYLRSRFLRRLENFPVLKEIRNTKLYGLLRYYLLSLRKSVLGREQVKKKSKTRPRMTPDEFRWGLEQVIELSEEHDFLPVFLLEPLNRSRDFETTKKKNNYIKKILEVAKEYDVLVINTIDAIHDNSAEWLFYDFIHPNVRGHQLIAEEMMESLFSADSGERTKKFLKGRGVDLERPKVDRVYRKQIVKSDLSKTDTLKVRLRAPYLASYQGEFRAYLDQQPLGIFSLSDSFVDYPLSLKNVRFDYPISELTLEARVEVSDQNQEFRVGQTDVYAPTFIQAVSGGKDFGWTVSIEVAGKRYDHDHRGYNVVVLGARSGQVLASGIFDTFGDASQSSKLASFLSKTKEYTEEGRAPVVIIAVKTDGRHQVNQLELAPIFRNLGGSGSFPEVYQSFILIGSPGAKAGTALELKGPELLKVQIGEPGIGAANLLEVSEVFQSP